MNMEEKINIAEILKDKPQGTKLYADAFGELSIEEICTEDELGIILLSSVGDRLFFYNDGKYNMQGEPILVPSKEMRDWHKFTWKRGDVLVNSRGLKILFDRWANNNYTSFYAKTINLVEDGFLDTNLHTLASEKEAKSFIKCIEEKLGGKLNRETLKIEKAQPEFKDGDIVTQGVLKGVNVCIIKNCIDKIDNKYNYYAIYNTQDKEIDYDDWSYISPFAKFATDSEKQQLFEALKKEGKAWDADKKEVADLKPKVELKPFDRVLVRDSKSDNWRANLFGYIGEDGYCHCVYANWAYCIPYEGNELLLGTSKDVEG